MNLRILPDLFDNPVNIKYSQQEADEYIELLLRQHKITNVPWIIVAILGIILPFLLPFVDALFFGFLPQIPKEILMAALILWYLLVMAYILEHFLYWYFNVYIVTNLHLVDVTMSSLLSKTTTEVFLKDVESAKTKVAGIFGSLFNFGDVIIETAAERQNIQFIAVPRPDLVAERIQDLQAATGEGGGHNAP